MQRGLTLNELAAKITANQELKHDFVDGTQNMEMAAGNDDVVTMLTSEGSYPILPIAHNQIGTYTDIPKRYYDLMLKEDRKLLSENVNTWLHRNPERRMARTLGGDLRAFLSTRYRRVENEHILEKAVLPVLADIPGIQFPSSEVTDKRMYLHFVVPSIQAEVKVGDVIQAGGRISNSEVGLGAVSIAGILWRLWCLNGASTEDQFSRTHVGRNVDSNEELWADDTMLADDNAILLKVRDMTKAVIDEARFKVKVDKLKGLAQAKITGDVVKAVEVLSQTVRATETEKQGILQSLIEGGDLSAWGLINAVTAQAHKGDYDRSVELESAGGALIELAPDQWKRVLEVEKS
jgi:hypothetical protein